MTNLFVFLAELVNMDTTFLYGYFKKEISMECPQGMSDEIKDDCVILNKCINGLVQTSGKCCKIAVKILKKAGFVGGNVDPCLYVKKSEKVEIST